jgi:DNA-binding NtrC family response regulator
VFYRVGGTRPLRVEVRLIAATNMDLGEAVKLGKFREDLYHRVSVIPLVVPPLRQRRPDIRPLAEYFAGRFTQELGKSIVGISDEAIITIERYHWPGNVRELQNTMERAVLLCDGKVILPRHLLLPGELQRSLPDNVRLAGLAGPLDDTEPSGFGIGTPRRFTDEESDTIAAGRDAAMRRPPTTQPAVSEESILRLEELERRAILRALELCHWNQVQAAERLGIHRNTLRKKITDYGLGPPTRVEETDPRDE